MFQKIQGIGQGSVIKAGTEARVIVAASKNSKVKKYIKLFDRHLIIQ